MLPCLPPPSVSSPVNYAQNETATALTATGTNLKWYTLATGGTDSPTAPTPSTTTVSTTSYWVSQTNANGCESERAKIDVVVSGACLGGTGNQARLYNPISADFDGDNDKDIIALDEGGAYWLYKNDGTGKFIAQQILNGLAWSTLEWKDLDGDSDIDLASTAGKIFINNGTGTFTELSGTFWTATGTINVVKIADFNKDGKQDILWLNSNVSAGYNNQVWLNSGTTGNPNFTLGSEFDNTGLGSNGGSVIGDIDKDGDIDLIACSGGGWNGKVYKNNGSGVFTSSQTLATYTGTGFIVDWDKDGDNDFLAFDTYNGWGLRLWTNNGAGTFSAPSSASLTDVTVGSVNQIVDLNGDTYPDVLCTNTATARYYLNTGCSLTLNSHVLSNARSAIADDFNNDGKQDIFCAARDAQSCIHLLSIPSTYIATTPPSVSTPVTYCQNATASALTATGTNLKWYTAQTGGTGSTTAPTPSTTAAGTISYWVSSTNANGCESERVKIDVVINALPSTPSVSTPITYCQNTTALALTATGTNLKWYTAQTGGTGSTTAPTPSTSTAGTISYWVSSTNANGCESERVKIEVVINALPSTPSVSTPVTYCQNTTASALTASGTNLKWYAAQTGGTGSTTAPTPSTTTAGTTSYWVSQTVNNCESERAKIEVTINSLPAAPSIITPINYAQGATTTALTATGSNLKWYTTATGGTGNSTAPTPSTTNLGTTSYWVSQSVNNCESERAKIEVIVSSTVAATHLNFSSNAYVNIGNLIASGSSYTKEAWIKTNNITGSNILSSSTSAFWFWQNNLQCGHGGGFIDVYTNASAMLNTWTHVAVTYDNPSKTMRLYVNGVLASEKTNVNSYTSANIQIGAYNNAANFNGDIDEVRIWDKALSADDILRRKNCELQGNEAGLTAYYKFNQGFDASTNTSITSLTDATSNNNNGTLNNFTLSGSTSNWLAGSSVTTGSTIPSTPSVSTPITYCQNATASVLTASGTNLKWYTAQTGGTGSTTAPTPSTATAETTSYWVSSTNANGCESERVKIEVVINALPSTPSVSTPVTYCQNETASALTATGTNLKWYTAQTGGTGSTTAPTPSTSTAGTTSYWVSSTNANGCESERVKIEIVINALPSTPSVSTPVTYCQNATASVLTASGTNLKWYTAQTGGTGSTTAPTPSTTTAGTVSYWVSSTNANGCESERVKIEVVINALPTAPTASNQSFYGSGTVGDLVATGTNIKWYAVTTGGTALSSTTALTNGATYYASQTNAAGCESTRTAVVVTISSIIVPPTVATPVTYCQNAPATALTATGINLKWYTSATGGIGNTTAPTPSTTTVGTTSYWVSSSDNNGNESQRSKIDVVINALPSTPSVSTPVTYCQNATASALTASGTNLKWYTAQTGGMGSTTAPTPSTSTAGTTSYWVSSTNANGCESERVKIEVVINALPSTPSVSTPVTYCQNATASALTATGTNLQWYTIATNGISSNIAPTANTTTAGTTSYWVSQTNANGCESNRAKIDVTVNSLTAAPTVSTPVSYCQNATATALTASGTNLKWYTTATGGTGNTSAPTPRTNIVGTTSYWVMSTNPNSCESERAKIDVITNALPTVPSVSTPVQYCQNAAATALTATGSNLRWYTAATGGTGSSTAPTPNTTTAGTTSYWVMGINENGCESDRVKLDITVNSLPASPTVSTPVTYCQNAAPRTLTANGTNLKWYITPTGGTGSTTAPMPNTNVAGTTSYWVLSVNDKGCESDMTKIDVTVNAQPIVNITGSTAICVGSSTSLSPSSGGTWLSSNPAMASVTNNGFVIGIAAGTPIFTFTEISTGCTSLPTAAVTVNANPTTPSILTSMSYCKDAIASPLTASGSNLTWYTTAIGGGTGSKTAPTPITTSVSTTSYWVMNTDANGCQSNRAKIDVTVETFKNSLTKQVILCKGQYFTFNLKNDKYPNLTHAWTSTNGYNSNKEKDTLRASGTYYVETITALNCRSKDTLTLSVDTTTIDANFAVATELVTVDVIKVVNISNTKNDSSRWIIPNGLKVVSNTAALLELTASNIDTGLYKIGLITFKGNCSAISYQDVKIYTKTFTQTANDSLYFVKTFTAYPNPNSGENLYVKIELSKESSVRLRLIDMSSNQVITEGGQ
jgi:hypothetical protein